MDISLPSRDALKAQAKRLRQKLTAAGTPVTHAQALEAIAHQWGLRDWNTLCAMAGTEPAQGYSPGQRLCGRYLGHRFSGVVKAADRRANGYWRLVLRFDDPVDVVSSGHFSALRQQVTAVVDASGRTPQKTSDGTPHVVISDHWSAV
ncbi:glyoxalase superfamily protein [uncultured Roseobacter sp.]|uniref:glyoxalase superfamily protein n=1 Tax=uncultured Roseobacter sp. TaxID=114847 RepID=UPI002636EB7C|nr:glyoxalase superfamily protein [uncultured Roseobacter sp.]